MTQIMSDLVERLRDGCVEHKRRWSGDTHADLGGSVDIAATDALMDEAAAEIERLGQKYDELAVAFDLLPPEIEALQAENTRLRRSARYGGVDE